MHQVYQTGICIGVHTLKSSWGQNAENTVSYIIIAFYTSHQAVDYKWAVVVNMTEPLVVIIMVACLNEVGQWQPHIGTPMHVVLLPLLALRVKSWLATSLN